MEIVTAMIKTSECLLNDYMTEVCEYTEVRVGDPLPLGNHERVGGVNFALFSRHASGVRLELFDHPKDATPTRFIDLDPVCDRTGDVWHVWLEGIRPGQLYAYRMDGSYQPGEGHLLNFDKLLLDPFATAISRLPNWDYGPARGYDSSAPEQDLVFSKVDNVGAMPKCVFTHEHFHWHDDRPPRHPWSKTVIYETHVRGFIINLNSGVELLQIAYYLDPSEIFVENGKPYKKKYEDITPLPTPANSASQVDSGYVSWETYAIFKDDDTRRDYTFGESVSGLSSNDVGLIQPPFSILPMKGIGYYRACSGGPPGIQTQEFVIENVPYEYAIPMLTGWELTYGCSGDQHVKEIGLWIDDIRYDKNQGTSVGTVRYKLSYILSDDSSYGGNCSKVTVLGLKPVASSGTAKQLLPDLVPFSPVGTTPTEFCRVEQGRKLLGVTFKNQGNADASPSKITVTFVNKPFTLDTPPIPAGASVDLLFKLPSGCFSPDYSFKINVDSSNQVNASNKQNNSANGAGKG